MRGTTAREARKALGLLAVELLLFERHRGSIRSMSVPRCPRCRLDLFAGAAGGVTMHGCGRCGGVWLDNASARRIHEAAPADAVALADSASAAAAVAVDAAAVAPCAGCGQPMARTTIQAAGVDVDSCAPHGTWFDRGELHAVADAFAAIRQKRGAGLATAALVGGAAVGVAAASQSPQLQSSLAHNAAAVADVAAHVGGAVVEIAGDAVASGAAEAVLEGAFALVGGIFELFG